MTTLLTYKTIDCIDGYGVYTIYDKTSAICFGYTKTIFLVIIYFDMSSSAVQELSASYWLALYLIHVEQSHSFMQIKDSNYRPPQILINVHHLDNIVSLFRIQGRSLFMHVI